MVVLDLEYVEKGKTIWRRHGWKMSSGEVGRKHLWEHIWWLREDAGDLLQVRWVPSHLSVEGNKEADELANQAGSCIQIFYCRSPSAGG